MRADDAAPGARRRGVPVRPAPRLGCRRRRSRPCSASPPPAPAICRPRPPPDPAPACRAWPRTAPPRSAPPHPGFRRRRIRNRGCAVKRRARLAANGVGQIRKTEQASNPSRLQVLPAHRRVCFQRVDAQINGRALLECRHLVRKAIAEGADEFGFQPLRIFPCHPGGRRRMALPQSRRARPRLKATVHTRR